MVRGVAAERPPAQRQKVVERFAPAGRKGQDVVSV